MHQTTFSVQSKPLSGADGTSQATAGRRKNVSIACNNCRSRRLKCSASLPACSRCLESGKLCIYEQDDNRKKSVWQSRIDSLKSENGQLKSILERLKNGTDTDATELLQQLRLSDSSLSESSPVPPPSAQHDERVARLPSSVSVQSNQSPSGPGSYAGSERPSTSSLTAGFREMSPLSASETGESSPTEFRIENLPPEHVTQEAVAGFFSCGATLFYIMTEDDARHLVRDVYHHPNPKLSHVAEVCALAAIGSQYVRTIDPVHRESFYRHAAALLDNSVELDDLTSMRVYIALSMYSIMDKNARVKGMVAYGLRIARHNLFETANGAGRDEIEAGRLMRTLAFMECWLSFTLGYSFSLTPVDIFLISEATRDQSVIIDADMIQAHMSRIALLSAQIYSDICHEKQPIWDTVKRHLAEVDRWSQELPDCLRLEALLSIGDGMSAHRRRSFFLVHLIRHGAHVLLYEHALGQIYQATALEPMAGVAFAQNAADVHKDYTAVGRQQAQTVSVLYAENSIFQRCWLMIHTSFHSSILLMLSMCQTVLLGLPRRSIPEDLHLVSTCHQVLTFCAEADSAARMYLQRLAPVLTNLQRALQKRGASPPPRTMSIESVVNSSVPNDKEFVDIIRQLVNLLLIPGEKVWDRA